MKPRTDLLRVAPPDAGETASVPELPCLKPDDEWDAVVLAEANLLSRWTGINATLVHWNNGTAASSDYKIFVDRAQLDSFFAGLTGEAYRTAIFFALAHEFGHLCQFAHLGVDATCALAPVDAEAHADYLAGAWLGLRLAHGDEHASDDVYRIGLKLKAETDDYPTEYQRGRLTQDAMGTTVLLVSIVEPQVNAPGYEKLVVALRESDVRQTLEIAKKLLRETPRDDSVERLIRPPST